MISQNRYVLAQDTGRGSVIFYCNIIGFNVTCSATKLDNYPQQELGLGWYRMGVYNLGQNIKCHVRHVIMCSLCYLLMIHVTTSVTLGRTKPQRLVKWKRPRDKLTSITVPWVLNFRSQQIRLKGLK